jgi:hypothetical protein
MAEQWIKAIQERLEKAKDEGAPFGACMLPDPNGGPPMCTKVDEATCKNLGGTFVGGDCG